MRALFFSILFLPILITNIFAQQPGWSEMNSGTTEELFSIHFSNDSIGYAVGANGTILKSTDAGLSWNSLSSNTSVALTDVFVFDSDVAVVTGEAGTILRTTDGGLNWENISSGVSDNLYSVSFAGTNGIAGGSSQTIIYSTDGGASWLESQSGFFGGGFYGVFMLSPQIGYVAGENSIFQPLFGKSTDAGAGWDFTAFYLNSNEGKARGVDFTDENTGYISSAVWDGQGAISKTTDSGINWNTTLYPNVLLSIDFPVSGASLIGYSAGEAGTILKTTNAGTNWTPQQSGTTLILHKIYFLDFNFGFAVGENGLILRTTSGGEPVTSVEDDITNLNSFRLEQNYPNPFNPTTKIKFSISDFQSTNLKIYDILGNEVATLLNEYKPAGEYEIEFNASDLPSGIYIYQLKSGSAVQTRKMTLLK